MTEYVKSLFTNLYNCFVDDSSLDVSGNVVDDDWETVDPEVIKRRLEEKRKIEESDHELTNELFNENYVKQSLHSASKPPPQPTKKKLKIDVNLINKSYIKTQEVKKQKERRRDVFGEAAIDEIDEMSNDIYEKHGIKEYLI